MIKPTLHIILTISVILLHTALSAQSFTDLAAFYNIETNLNSFDNYGASVSFYDFNQDGLDDLTFATENDSILFYKNNGNGFDKLGSFAYGDGTVKQVSWVDIDNDQDFDLFITVFNGTSKLLINNGNFNFTDVSTSAGLPTLATGNYGVSFADYDNDGYLDFYLTNYNYGYLETDHEQLNRLYRNNGDGTFQNRTIQAGVGDSIKASFQGLWFDHNMDGWIDLFVINDRAPFENSLYENNGDGTFTDISDGSGLEFEGGNPMTATIDDINNDGYPDIYNTNVGNGNPTRMFVNNGNGTFTDQSASLGTFLDLYTWGAVFIDYDNDTWQDLYVATGHPSSFFSQQKSKFYENIGGQYFIQTSGPFLGDLTSASFAVAKGDINSDGYYDIVSYNDDGEEPFLWQNSGGSNSYIKLSLEGTTSNYSAIGAFIQVYANGECYSKFTYSVENYISQNSQHIIFGLGQAAIVDSLKIKYPSGHVDQYYNLDINMRHRLTEGETSAHQIGYSDDTLSCSNTTVELNIANGDSVIWNNAAIGNTVNISQTGYYFAEIVLDHYSIYSDTIFVDFIEAPVIIPNTEHISCYGANDGNAELLINSTISPSNYTINWSNGATGVAVSNLNQGFHSYYYEDIYSCIDSGQVYIEEPFPVSLLLNVQDEINGTDGSIDVFAFGGVPPYSLYFENQLSNPPYEGLNGGVYELLIQDANGCVLDTTVEVGSFLSLTNDFTNDLYMEVFPNPIKDNTVKIITDQSQANITLKIIDPVGRVISSKYFSSLGSGETIINLPDLSPGTYTFIFSTQGSTVFKRIQKL